MPERPFYIVDVFAERRYAGNQLAVVTRAEGLSSDEMQSIAREFNFAETTFLTGEAPRDGGYDVRIFTPRFEVPFAGHPTLGTAWVVREALAAERGSRVVLNTRAGQIPVTFDEDVLWMRQNTPLFGATTDAATMSAVLGVEPGDVDAAFPIQEVSTGLPAWIVPLLSIDAVRRARLDVGRYESLIESSEAKNILLFSRETEAPENQLHVRMFAHHFGVPEDPATGSANGCLAGWLVEHRYLGDGSVAARVEQGYEMGRPSLLRLKARRREDGIGVDVGGRVVPVARGEWL